MRCSQVQNLLPEYVEGALAAAQQEGLAAHLHGCPTCAAEERSYQLAFDALNERKTVAAPDLWAAFSARLANELSCAEARELIPLQTDSALLAGRADALQAHLAMCSPCAVEASLMGRAVAALDGVAARLPDVDLWPAFAARTGDAPARTSFFGNVRRALSPARNPLGAPILAMAAFAGVLFGAQFLLNRAPELGPPTLPVAKEITQPAPAPVQPKTVKVPRPTPVVADAKVTPPAVTPRKVTIRRKPRTVALAVAKPAPTSSTGAIVVAKTTGAVRPRVRIVGFDPGITPTADRTLVSTATTTESNSDAAQAMVIPEVVQAVALLLDFGDSASDPFGGAE